MKYLIICMDEEDLDGMNLLATGGMTEHAHPVFTNAAAETEGNEKLRGWYVNQEANIQPVCEYLTRNFPGANVEVYALQAVHVRPVGEMESKSVDKNGILPKKG